MINGSNKDAPASGRARLVAVTPSPLPPSTTEAQSGEAVVAAGAIESGPERMHWIVVPSITLVSALAGGAAAWLVR